MYTHAYICVDVCMYIYIYMHMSLYTNIYIYRERERVRDTCMYMYIYIYIYTHTLSMIIHVYIYIYIYYGTALSNPRSQRVLLRQYSANLFRVMSRFGVPSTSAGFGISSSMPPRTSGHQLHAGPNMLSRRSSGIGPAGSAMDTIGLPLNHGGGWSWPNLTMWR